MYCKNCGTPFAPGSTFCGNCGYQETAIKEDKPNFGFALIGFFIPIVGLILYLIYESETPLKAKSAGKGALSGFITGLVISLILVGLYFAFVFSLIKGVTGNFGGVSSIIEEVQEEISEQVEDKTTAELLAEDVDVTFGEFTVTQNGHFTDSSLAVTIKNKDDGVCTYSITIEAVDENGARITTDSVYADRLGSGQEIHVTAFGYVEEENLEEMRNATFRVLEIEKFERD